MKPIPVLYENKVDCCGCSACYAICPKSAIEMKEDEEGFEYPVIDAEKCIRCYMCLKVCPIKGANEQYWNKKACLKRAIHAYCLYCFR